ncbi:MAG: hypothetical protein VX970_09285 [Planctomycetota bacterium]|nr:hypothetical protein [Planctomycetota bacterium]
MGDETNAELPSMQDATRRLHLVFGWWQLLVFLSLGIGLEMMHGFKVGWYLDADQETRRLMLTLAHTHGTLLGLVNLAFSWSVTQIGGWKSSNLWVASRSLIAASVLMPLGFFLGGLITYAGDPNLAILLLPAGGFFLLVSALLTALAATKSTGRQT